LIQDGHNDELEKELEILKQLFEQQMSAAEAEMDAEENEHKHKLTKNLNDEHTAGLRETQRQIMKVASDNCPASEQVALQRLMDEYRKEQEGLSQELNLEKQRLRNDLQVISSMFLSYM
jgi:C1A family cysteine protease